MLWFLMNLMQGMTVYIHGIMTCIWVHISCEYDYKTQQVIQSHIKSDSKTKHSNLYP